jgi:hypothetical protein
MNVFLGVDRVRVATRGHPKGRRTAAKTATARCCFGLWACVRAVLTQARHPTCSSRLSSRAFVLETCSLVPSRLACSSRDTLVVCEAGPRVLFASRCSGGFQLEGDRLLSCFRSGSRGDSVGEVCFPHILFNGVLDGRTVRAPARTVRPSGTPLGRTVHPPGRWAWRVRFLTYSKGRGEGGHRVSIPIARGYLQTLPQSIAAAARNRTNFTQAYEDFWHIARFQCFGSPLSRSEPTARFSLLASMGLLCLGCFAARFREVAVRRA